MIKLKKIFIYNDYDVECSNGEIKFSDAGDCDYDLIALIDIDKDKVIYKMDTTHGSPFDYIDGFIDALNHSDIEYTIKSDAMHENEFNKTYK